MTKKNEIPVYTAGIDELIHEINSRTNELMRNNFDNPLDGLLKIRPVKIDGIEYDHIALIHFDDYPARVGARLVSTPFQTDLPVFKLDDTAPLYDILSSVKKGYFSNEHTGEAVAANPAVYKFEVGDRVKFSTTGPSGKEEPVTGEVEKAGTAYNIRHIFGAPAITVNGREYFVDDIKENTLTVPAVSSYGFKGYDKPEDFRKDLSGLPVKDFDIQVDKEMLFPLETAWRERNLIEDHPNIRTVNIRNRQVQSVSGEYLELRGYNDKLQEELYADKQFSIDVEDLNSKEQQILSAFLARKIPYYIKPWANQLAEDIKTQAKADRVTARTGKLVALMPDPGDKMTFKKPMALDDCISIDGIGDMEITSIRNAGDGRFTVSDGERVIPFGRMMEWDQESVVTMCEQLDRENTAKTNLAAGSKEAGSLVKSLIMDIAAYEVAHLSLDSKKGVSWDDIKETLDDDTLMIIDDLDKHVQETVARVSLTKELDAMRATNGNSIKVPLTYVGIGPESGIDFTEIRYLEDYKEYAGVGTYGNWLSMKNVPADQVALVHNKLLIAQLADMIGEGNTVKLQNPVTVNVLNKLNVKIDSVRIASMDDTDIELVATGSHERDGKTFEDELDDSDLSYSVHPEDLKEVAESVRQTLLFQYQKNTPYTPLFNSQKSAVETLLNNGEGIIEHEASESIIDAQQTDDNNEKLLSDADIARQYSGYKVTGIKFYEQTQPDAFSGVVDLEFPNADHPDFDKSMSNPFISYDSDGQQIAFDRWLPDEVYMDVRNAIREERPKHLIREAIVSRILDPSPSATFTKEQQDVIVSYLKDYPSVDKKLQALSPLWQEAEKDARVKGEPSEWFTPVKEELNDLASGIRREPGEGLKLK